MTNDLRRRKRKEKTVAIIVKETTAFISHTKGRVILLSSETPASLTIDGSDVDGVQDDYVFAAGSELITPDADYIAFEDGVFTQKYNAAPATEETQEEDPPEQQQEEVLDGEG